MGFLKPTSFGRFFALNFQHFYCEYADCSDSCRVEQFCYCQNIDYWNSINNLRNTHLLLSKVIIVYKLPVWQQWPRAINHEQKLQKIKKNKTDLLQIPWDWHPVAWDWEMGWNTMRFSSPPRDITCMTHCSHNDSKFTADWEIIITLSSLNCLFCCMFYLG